MEITVITRTFFHGEVELEDINPNSSTESILSHYSGIYPELTSATVINKGLQPNNKIRYEFRNNIGTKG